MSGEKRTLGAAIFADIEDNEYLNKIHEKVLYNYALRLLQLTKKEPLPFDQKEKRDALRFADLLSKSNDPEKANAHKIWAQEIVILLNELYPEDTLIKLYAGDVFSSIGNHKGIEHINSEYQDITALERFFSEFRDDYLTIPAEPDEKFFAAQKTAYDHLTDDCFSYSAPTSMGKSFIMRMFIKNEVIHGAQKNYALIVPTKALINEVRGKVIDDLGENGNLEKINYLDRCNYRVVTAASDIALEEEHNYIFVLTPERLLYLLISQPKVQIDYLFIDEAHKLSGKNSRAPFYYKVVDMLLKREPMAIKNNDLRYPEVKDGYFRHDVVLEFLKKLSNVFQWKIYESSTLGKDSLLSWYAVILCEWMEGNGLNYIMRAALKHHREKPDDFWINRYTKGVYDDTSLIHRNIVFADTLEVIENVILFSISNYFLRFSNEFRRIKGDDELDANNWYEYVEYGTTNPLTILLQRNGFSRESARFIKENPEYVVKDGSTGKLKLKASLSKCGRTSVENEVEYIRQNVPGIFVGEEE